ncbi:tetratricopeptide repeat protein [Desulfovibrio inopinatus]|uniref:tetratricopeptide repeat protein n=1 Tax=Desulfovibrio inopinatus TaxID=102109 RepID=UPI0003F964EB|nr:tetratricopeptide repeat protein [Desulfovibrio inopinatus]
MRPKQYDEDVRDFIQNRRGILLVLSPDQLFIKNLRATLVRHLLIKEDCVRNIAGPDMLQKELKKAASESRNIVFFIEREFNGRPTTDLIQYIKNDFREMFIIVLTNEVAREKLILLHEVGAENFITKPISPDTLIEKIAFTVRPRGQIGELIEAGKQFLELQQFERAVEIGKKVLEIKENSPSGYILLGDAFRGLGKKDQALAAYTQASKSAKLYLEPLKRIALVHKEEGNVQEEQKYLEQLDKLSPLNIERKVSIGANFIKLGQEDKAKTVFDSALKLATKEAMSSISKVSRAIAEQCMQTNPKLSEHYLRQTLEAKANFLDKSDIDTFNRLGITLRRQGRWEDSITEYRKALKISPNDPGLYYNIAMAFTEGKNYQEAYNHLVKAIKINPQIHRTSETVCYNIAAVFHRADKKDLALEYAQYTLKMKPNFTKAMTLLREIQQSQ